MGRTGSEVARGRIEGRTGTGSRPAGGFRRLGPLLLGVLLAVSPARALESAGPVAAGRSPLAVPGHVLLPIDDPELMRIQLALPEGAGRVLIHPDSDIEREGSGAIEVQDGRGRTLLVEQGIGGLALKLARPGRFVRSTGPEEFVPLEIELPPSVRRIEISGQYYDPAGQPLADGVIRAFDATGAVVMEESDLELDLFLY